MSTNKMKTVELVLVGAVAIGVVAMLVIPARSKTRGSFSGKVRSMGGS